VINNSNKSEYLWTIGAILGFALLLVVGYKIKVSITPSIVATAPLDTSCDLRKGKCTTVFPTGEKISLSMTPNSIPVLRPLVLNVTIEGIDASNIEVDFIGIDMDMGYNRSKLNKINAGNFKGKVVIPACSHSRMEWEAQVLLHTSSGLIMAPFRFYTLK